MFMKIEQKRIVTSVVGRFFEIFSFSLVTIDSPREVMSRPSDVSQKLDGSSEVCLFIFLVGIPVTQEHLLESNASCKQNFYSNMAILLGKRSS